MEKSEVASQASGQTEAENLLTGLGSVPGTWEALNKC